MNKTAMKAALTKAKNSLKKIESELKVEQTKGNLPKPCDVLSAVKLAREVAENKLNWLK